MKIQYFNRYKNQLEIEKVYGDAAIKFLYSNPLGKSLGSIVTRKIYSKIYGVLQDSNLSKGKITPFINKFEISLDEFLPEEGRTSRDPYSSFNTFFIRRFKEGVRLFNQHNMAAFSEGRYFGYESLSSNETVPVKGEFLSSKQVLKNTKWSDIFMDGPMLLSRLCPVDYHRFHYPCNGSLLESYFVRGKLHSVNPIALKEYMDIFSTNERQISILDTKEYGKLAFVEVGAICVGKIVQTHLENEFKRGGEKGYFLFGGSTIILFGEKGKWKPSQDILDNTKNGFETYIRLGDAVSQS